MRRTIATIVAAGLLTMGGAGTAFAVRGGQTIAAFARSKGVEPQRVKDAVLGALTQRIDQAVAEGKVAEDRAARVKGRLPERVDKVLSSLPARASGTDQEPTSLT